MTQLEFGSLQEAVSLRGGLWSLQLIALPTCKQRLQRVPCFDLASSRPRFCRLGALYTLFYVPLASSISWAAAEVGWEIIVTRLQWIFNGVRNVVCGVLVCRKIQTGVPVPCFKSAEWEPQGQDFGHCKD